MALASGTGIKEVAMRSSIRMGKNLGERDGSIKMELSSMKQYMSTIERSSRSNDGCMA